MFISNGYQYFMYWCDSPFITFNLSNLNSKEVKINKSILMFITMILFTVVSILQGYRFGTGDLDTYVPFVLHASDSSLFSSDLLIKTIGVHPVYIWSLFGMLSRLIPVETLFFGAFLFQIAFNIAAIILFYRNFFGKNNWYILVLSVLLITKAAAAMGVYGLNPYNHFHPCALAFGVMLLCFIFWDKKKWITGSLLCGSIFLFHPFTAITTSLCFFFTIILQFKKTNKTTILLSILSLLAIASPALYPYFTHIQHPSTTSFDTKSWFEIVKVRMAHSFFISQWVSDRFVHLIIAVVLLVAAFRKHNAFKALLPLILAIVSSLCAMFLAEIFSIKFILQLQLGRNSYYIFVLLIMFLCYRISQSNFSKLTIKDSLWILGSLFLMMYSFVEHRKDFAAIISTILVFLTPVMLYIMGRIGSIHKYARNATLYSFCGIVVLLLSIATITITIDRHRSINRYFNTESAYDFEKLALWVRNNVSIEETIMTPIYLEGFRSYSHHSIFPTWKDGAPHNYSEATFFKWWEKMNLFGITTKTDRNSFAQLYHEKAFDIAKSEKLKFVVYEKKYLTRTVKSIFENETYGITQIE